jgi:predicted TIM-barrel fold metal-dependent hydrolase
MIVDVNVHLGRWPFRRLKGDEPAELVAKLKAQNVQSAWAGSFDALLHRDIAAVNLRLAEECQRHGKDLLVPFGTVNPTLPFWEDDLRRCHESHKMPGIRLYPAWHGYRLDHPSFAALLKAASAQGLIVQLALRLEDERTLHPLLRLHPIDLTPLPELIASLPRLRLVLLNHGGVANADVLRKLTRAGQVYVDIATVEGLGGIGRLLQTVPADRVLFGSHYPFFYYESAVLKLRESKLEPAQEKVIHYDNAKRLLSPP